MMKNPKFLILWNNGKIKSLPVLILPTIWEMAKENAPKLRRLQHFLDDVLFDPSFFQAWKHVIFIHIQIHALKHKQSEKMYS